MWLNLAQTRFFPNSKSSLEFQCSVREPYGTREGPLTEFHEMMIVLGLGITNNRKHDTVKHAVRNTS